METVKKRIEWVDIGKFICIMAVMLSHLDIPANTLEKIYRPFYLTGFCFFAGYVFRQPPSFRKLMKKKAGGLFIPWLIFSNFNIALSAIVSFRDNRNFLSEFCWNLLQISGHYSGMWFVAVLFMAFIPFYFLVKWEKPVKALGVSGVMAVVGILYTNLFPGELLPWGDAALPWHIEHVMQVTLWMLLGYYFRRYTLKSGVTVEKAFDDWNTAFRGIILCLCYLIAALVLSQLDSYLGYFSISSILGVPALVLLCKKLKSNRYIRYVGANTLTYFALHGKVFPVLEKVLGRFSFYNVLLQNELTASLLAIAITVIVSLLLIIPAEIINRYFPWVLGRTKKAQQNAICGAKQ